MNKKQIIQAKQVVEHCLKESDDINVVIGPVVWHSNTPGKYFIIATSEPTKQFRADQIIVEKNYKQANQTRAEVIAAFICRPLVIHDCDDELYMARLCECLWPGEKITRLRKQVEAERALWGGEGPSETMH